MMALGNEVGNSVWEANLRGQAKPSPRSSREDKERWIRAKYEAKEFLAVPQSGIPLNEQVSIVNCVHPLYFGYELDRHHQAADVKLL